MSCQNRLNNLRLRYLSIGTGIELTTSATICSGRRPLSLAFRGQYQPVGQHGLGHGFHVVRCDEVPAVERGVGLGCLVKRESRARTGAQRQPIVLPRGLHYLDNVAAHDIVHPDRRDGCLHLPQLILGGHRVQVWQHSIALEPQQDVGLLLRRRVARASRAP